MHHNEQLLQYGSCRCRCHHGAIECTCQLSKKWRARPSVPPKQQRKLRDSQHGSRVRPFQRQYHPVISFKAHGMHALRYTG